VITRRRTGDGGPGDRRGEYALGRLIADAQRAATGADLAIMNNGGIRTDLEAGPVTWGMLYQLQPFQNRLVRLRLPGDAVIAALEHALAGPRPMAHVSGMRVRYDPGAPPGERVRDIVLDDGRPLRRDARYTVVVNDFLAEGGDGYAMFPEAGPGEETGIVDLDALVDYVRALPQPVRGDPEPRFLPASSTATIDEELLIWSM
jgi:5'-nucleotidase